MKTSRPGAVRWALATLFATHALLGCGSSRELESPAEESVGDPARPPVVDGLDRDPHSVIVRFKAATGRASLRAIQTASLDRIGATFLDRDGDGVYDRFSNLDRSGRLMKLDLPKSANVADALAELRRDPAVEYAEPNYVVRISDLPDDPGFGSLHGLHNTGQLGGTPDADIDAPEAWDLSIGSSDVVVGVIDTGVDYDHRDLAANMWRNPGEIADNGIDDDGNGVVDDVHGFNAITGSGDPMDDNDHGTHCAGTIGAVGDNGVGVAGVNWNVSIMALKFLSAGGNGLIEDAIAAIDYAVGMRAAGVNLRVLSASWGGTSFSQGLEDAVEEANLAGILFVAAAGNSAVDTDATPHYPSALPNSNIVSVAATDFDDGLAYFSNFGRTSVDLGAPGYLVVSTVRNNRYATFNGTSMAAPHVAGAAALALSVDSELTTAQLKELLLTTGDEVPGLGEVTVSGRRLNARNAVAAAGPPAPRFELAVGPPSLALDQGGTASYQVDLGAIGGFSESVSLEVTSNPPINASISVAPQLVAVPGSSTISVVTSAATAPGAYALTVTGRSGSLLRSRTVGLVIHRLGGAVFEASSADTPLPIPDGVPRGIDSVLSVPAAIDVDAVEVELDIAHTWIGDLRVTLTSPLGTEVVLHEHEGDSDDDIHRRYIFPTELAGEQAYGDWTLHVVDYAEPDPGTLEGWTLRVRGAASAPTFLVKTSAPSVEVVQNTSAQVEVSLISLAGFDGEVSLSAFASPALAAQLSFSPARIPASGPSTLTISPSCDAAPGTYVVSIIATSGAILKEAKVTVEVSSFGLEVVTFPGDDPPLSIPDNDRDGVASELTVTDDLQIERLSVEVHITHPNNQELNVWLFGPKTWELLYDGDGGGSDGGADIHATFSTEFFDGMSMTGQWALVVVDYVAGTVGTLDSWAIHTTGARARAPVASFTHEPGAQALQVAFTDTSASHACGGIVEWYWEFGDGFTSSAQRPSHTYAAPGSYQVTLTATNNRFAAHSITETITVSPPPARSLLDPLGPLDSLRNR